MCLSLCVFLLMFRCCSNSKFSLQTLHLRAISSPKLTISNTISMQASCQRVCLYLIYFRFLFINFNGFNGYSLLFCFRTLHLLNISTKITLKFSPFRFVWSFFSHTHTHNVLCLFVKNVSKFRHIQFFYHRKR